MIEHEGIIDRIEGDMAHVKINSVSGCASCHAKGVCSAADQEEKYLDVPLQGAAYRLGEQVQVQVAKHLGFRAVALGYGQTELVEVCAEQMQKLPEAVLEVTVAIEHELSRVPMVYTDELGREVFGLISPIGSNGWHVVIQVPIAAIKAINASLWGVYLYTMIGSAIFAFLIGWLLLRRFTLVRGKSATTSRNDEVLHRLKNIEKIVGDAQRQINTISQEIKRNES